jgi:hypothetical protein
MWHHRYAIRFRDRRAIAFRRKNGCGEWLSVTEFYRRKSVSGAPLLRGPQSLRFGIGFQRKLPATLPRMANASDACSTHRRQSIRPTTDVAGFAIYEGMEHFHRVGHRYCPFSVRVLPRQSQAGLERHQKRAGAFGGRSMTISDHFLNDLFLLDDLAL